MRIYSSAQPLFFEKNENPRKTRKTETEGANLKACRGGVENLHWYGGSRGTSSTRDGRTQGYHLYPFIFGTSTPTTNIFGIFFKTDFWDLPGLYPTFFLKPWDINVILMVKNQSKVNNSMIFSSLNVKFCWKMLIKISKTYKTLVQNCHKIGTPWCTSTLRTRCERYHLHWYLYPLDDESKAPPQCRFSTPPTGFKVRPLRRLKFVYTTCIQDGSQKKCWMTLCGVQWCFAIFQPILHCTLWSRLEINCLVDSSLKILPRMNLN